MRVAVPSVLGARGAFRVAHPMESPQAARRSGLNRVEGLGSHLAGQWAQLVPVGRRVGGRARGVGREESAGPRGAAPGGPAGLTHQERQGTHLCQAAAFLCP